ncbi:MAG: bifunctional lysylphosphatidylglycerol flippase/synthetase MprF [Kiritimatiellales bacterium]
MKKRFKNFRAHAGYLISITLFAVALTVIHHKLKQYHLHDVLRQMHQVPVFALLAAAGLTILNYLTLTLYDTMALRYLGRKISYLRTAGASFIGYAFSHNATVFGGGAARYRIYSSMGLSTPEVARLILFCGVTSWLGFITAGGAVSGLFPADIPALFNIPSGILPLIGPALLTVPVVYLIFTLLRKRPLQIRDWEFTVPSIRFAAVQTAISALDWTLAASVFYALLPDDVSISFPQMLLIFMSAQFAGVLSTVPAGLGVFDTVVLVLLSPAVDPAAVAGILLLYRVIYYLLPLAAATLLLAGTEIVQRRAAIRRVGKAVGRWSGYLIPYLAAGSCFIAGLVLLISGALPLDHGRLAWLNDVMPLPAMELSHFLGSLTGLLLLILARGLQRRLDAAWHLTVLLLGAGIVFSLLKGLEYEQAFILLGMLAVIGFCRSQFYRKTSLIHERFTAGWMALVTAALGCTVWIGLFAYKHVEYRDELWWRFALHGDAPRFLRATAGAAILFTVFAIYRLLDSPEPDEPVTADDRVAIENARRIAAASPVTQAWLSVLGDKQFLFSKSGNAFLMYAVENRSWIALGDPVGPEEEWEELIWRFCERCDEFNAWPVFCHISDCRLDLYIDAGFTFVKLGETGRVALTGFTMDDSAHKDLRYIRRKLSKEGCVFEMIPEDQIEALLPELRGISDAWLGIKNTREKGFTLGFFDEAYLRNFPAAIVRQNGKLIAFSNVWKSGGREELSIDLMRHLPEAPNGTMDFLFIELMCWGHEQGYRWFDLGTAPLSGLENRSLAPLWARTGTFIFSHGEHFYNFQGLRRYKEKFLPQWEPRYLACSKARLLPRILADLATLISGGLKGLVSK